MATRRKGSRVPTYDDMVSGLEGLRARVLALEKKQVAVGIGLFMLGVIVGLLVASRND